jgi:hypothetical protein
VKNNLPCSKELRAHNCTDENDRFLSFWSSSENRAKICLGCPILKMTIEEKSIEGMAIILSMDPHTVATFRNGILWRLNNNEGIVGYFLNPHSAR